MAPAREEGAVVRLGIIGGHDTGHARAYGLAARDWQADGPRPVFTAIWCEDPAASRAVAGECGIAHVAAQASDLLEQGTIDAVMVLHKEPSEHLAVARPFLEAGLPTYINKPIAYSVAEAEQLVRTAEQAGTPLFSCSALRYSPQLAEVARRRQACGPWRAVLAAGYRDLLYYGVHAVEMVVTVLGTGVAWVQNLGHEQQDALHVAYADGRTAEIIVLRDAVQTFLLTAFGERGWAQAEVGESTAEHPMFAALLTQVAQMALTRRPPVRYEETIEILRIVRAGEESRRRAGERVSLQGAL